jgi:hypothetical protein
MIYNSDFLASLLQNYELSGRNSIVAHKVRRIGYCVDQGNIKFSPYMIKVVNNWWNHEIKIGSWPFIHWGYKELLLLPIGFGGILYRPRFFHPVVFSSALLNLTRTADDLLFRLSTIMNGIDVISSCPTAKITDKSCKWHQNFIRLKLIGILLPL